MGVAMKSVERKHYLLATDWNAMPLESMAEQCGSWLLIDNYDVKLSATSTMQFIIESANGSTDDKRRRAAPKCKIGDAEGFAILDLLKDMRDTKSEVVHEWLNVFELYYIHFWSDERISSRMGIGRNGVAECRKLAIAHICAKRPSIHSFLTK